MVVVHAAGVWELCQGLEQGLQGHLPDLQSDAVGCNDDIDTAASELLAYANNYLNSNHKVHPISGMHSLFNMLTKCHVLDADANANTDAN